MPVFRAVIVVLIAAASALGVDVDYNRDIKPMLHEKCSTCHGALKQEAGLRLDAAVLIRTGGDSGPVIHTGDATASLLIERVTTKDVADRMPPEGEGEPLTPAQMERLQAWINAGAIAPQDEPIPTNPDEHWAYQVPERAKVPRMENDQDCINPIDAFIAQRQHESGIIPAGLADKETLVRRVYFDLIGLPPTREQIDAFVSDQSTEAYPRLVDRLLGSPQYGERWGRHWMDVWRYSDWNGYKEQLRGSQRHIWRWRDWIIESLNADKGYDQMIVEMLAGDEVAGDDLNVLRATGFLARNYHNSNRNIWLDATVEHTAKAFLGMTINCAKCHDHKFDPIAQNEYYAMRAIFEPYNVRTERIVGQRNLTRDGVPRVYDAEPDAKTYLYVRGDEKHFDKDSPLSAAVPTVFGDPLDIQPVALPPVAVFPALWPQIEAEDLAVAKQQIAVAKNHLAKVQKDSPNEPDSIHLATLKLDAETANLHSLTARWSADKAKYSGKRSGDLADGFDQLAKTAAEAEHVSKVLAARLKLAELEAALVAAESSQETDAGKKTAAINKAKNEVDAAAKQLATVQSATSDNLSEYTPVGKAYPDVSTGRRLALAKWITRPNNPLTARVAINHIWLRHFGAPLVANTFDFGLRSTRPIHADLLDWLSVELIEQRWSMKHIHRLMVTSRAYQRLSAADQALTTVNQKIDPDNSLYWRANARRLDAEVIRDSMLFVAGNLDLQQGGADIDYASGETVTRRSVYFRHAYEKQMTMLVLFDAAGPNECYRRSESIIPQQALTLANSPLSISQSRTLAHELSVEAEDGADPESRFIRLAFRQILARPPSVDELAVCRSFLAKQTALLSAPDNLSEFGGKIDSSVDASADPHMRSRENIIHVLINHNDFVTVR
ncbi:MAG: PSD1 domain-containing protein [Planctomycetales bacterium]|nr:PSD1 domain-containing protein [Planctomycetales bacterium]